MAFVASCGSCGGKFQAQDHLAGKTVACPSCGGKMTIPAREAAAHSAARPAAAAPSEQIVACKCGARFKAGPQLAGKTVRCPTCQQPLVVPITATGRASAAPAPAPAQPAYDADFWGELDTQKEPEKVAPEPEPAEEALTGHRATAYAINRLSQGYSPAAVREELLAKGASQAEAQRVVEGLHGEVKSRSRGGGGGGGGGEGFKNMAIGGVFFTIGVVVTVGSFMAAEPGGAYLLAWGPIIFGGIQFFRGLAQLAS